MNSEALAVSPEPRETFWRSLHALNLTRFIIACVLLIYWESDKGGGILEKDHQLCQYTSAVYLVLALAFAALPLLHQRHFLPQLLAQILVDVAAISVLFINSGGMKSGLAILYLFPLASSAILMTLVLSLFFGSLVTLVMLLDSVFRLLHREPDPRLTQAGMYGAAFLAAVYVVNRLAARLISQEALASQRGSDLQVQLAINRLAIASMDDGFMVVSADGTILACNPAAERILGLSLAHDMLKCRMSDILTLQSLADAYAVWKELAGIGGIENEGEPASPIHLLIKHTEDAPAAESGPNPQAHAAHFQARFVPVPTHTLQEELAIIFLQDMADIEQQAQQLKLASMGRLTASIAHEVRNPLAAIDHASSLLAEEFLESRQERLLKIVKDNVGRMNRMVGDILNLSRRAQSHEVVELSSLLGDIKDSFKELHGLPDGVLRLEAEEGLMVRFDSLHLREVVLNLMSNAIRYASGKQGSIRIRAVRHAQRRAELHVHDDGPSISSEVRAHLFEPFYTTSSKGTGLGLYLARELCMNNGARLDYEYHRDARHGPVEGRFVIMFAPVGNPEFAQHSWEKLA